MAIGPATYRLLVSQVRARVTQTATATWLGMGSWRDADVDAFVSRIVPLVVAGQRQVATLTDAFLAEQVAELFGTAARPAGLSPEEISGEATRQGADPHEVYRRPAVETYMALQQGLPLDAAVRRGAGRLESLVGTDMQLARTHATVAALRDSPAQYYRRVLHGSKNCALCIVASTQRYTKDRLMPIHPGCDCGVQPVTGRVPHVLDKARLNQLHSAIRAETGSSARDARQIDYRKILVTHEHGEYGPTLAFRGQTFTGPGEIQ